MRKTLATLTIACAAALSLTACGLFEPSLESRAVTAAETISVAIDEQNAATADIEAQQADVQAKIDAAEAKGQPAEDAYMNSDTKELEEAQAAADAAYENAEAADETLYDSDWEDDAEYERLEAEASAAWDSFNAADEKVMDLTDSYENAYENAQAELEDARKPLDKEMERLDALYSESFSGPVLEMSFALMAACPELMAASEDADMTEAVSEVDITEGCVTALEAWAEKL